MLITVVVHKETKGFCTELSLGRLSLCSFNNNSRFTQLTMLAAAILAALYMKPQFCGVSHCAFWFFSCFNKPRWSCLDLFLPSSCCSWKIWVINVMILDLNQQNQFYSISELKLQHPIKLQERSFKKRLCCWMSERKIRSDLVQHQSPQGSEGRTLQNLTHERITPATSFRMKLRRERWWINQHLIWSTHHKY